MLQKCISEAGSTTVVFIILVVSYKDGVYWTGNKSFKHVVADGSIRHVQSWYCNNNLTGKKKHQSRMPNFVVFQILLFYIYNLTKVLKKICQDCFEPYCDMTYNPKHSQM